MGNLIRRNKAIPVQARRADQPEQVIIPVAVPMPGAPAVQPSPPVQPNVSTTNIFYISTPAAPAPAAPVTPPPTEVHYHTTVHHAPRRERGRKSISYFGMMSICSGALAIAGSYSSILAPIRDQIGRSRLDRRRYRMAWSRVAPTDRSHRADLRIDPLQRRLAICIRNHRTAEDERRSCAGHSTAG